jgi:hypothetical protein
MLAISLAHGVGFVHPRNGFAVRLEMTRIAEGTTYRINEPTLAIYTDADGTKVPVTLPRDAILVIQDSEVDGNTFCRVEWQQKSLIVFAMDLESRGVCIDPNRD